MSLEKRLNKCITYVTHAHIGPEANKALCGDVLDKVLLYKVIDGWSRTNLSNKVNEVDCLDCMLKDGWELWVLKQSNV